MGKSPPARRDRLSGGSELPHRHLWLVRLFQWYARRYVRKHFHAVRLSKFGQMVPTSNEPLLIVLNHPAWWDPMICTVLAYFMAER